ncbi:EAL domain-containing protein [Shewanella eurypsychrophilus]|uniref:EAL domain-containing protein n=1 Tax=Shewanella eurypsychrophilus TaxID=2593656 RepID=A0ABX6VFU3_9GAMM|nr:MULTISPECIES: EAL domain-containing protein [Shewanella]QPG60304.2 EAL domain-containing protein [Shewanella eurypsychrophilus]
MKGIRTLSLKLWLPGFILFTFFSLGGFVVLQVYQDLESELINSSLNFIRKDISALQRQMEKQISHNRLLEAGQSLSARGVNTRYKVLISLDENGKILHSTRFAIKGMMAHVILPQFEIKRFIQIQKNKQMDIRLSKDGHSITAYYPLILARSPDEIRPTQTGGIFVIYDLTPEQSQIWSNVSLFSIPIGLLLLIAMTTISLFLNLFVTRPIQNLVNSSNDLAKGQLKARCQIQGQGEIALLGRSFNDMAIQLEERFELSQKAELAILEQKHLMTDILNSTAEAIYGIDLNGNCIFANPTCINILGYTDIDQLLGKNMHDLIHYKHADFTPYKLEDCPIYGVLSSSEGVHVDAEKLWRADGTGFTSEYWSYPIEREGKTIGAVVTFLDTTDREKAAELIRHQAHYDTLTDLPNRFLALERLSQMLEESERSNENIAVLFLDLDDFKKINDSLGHETGDKLLIEAAERLRTSIRNGDTVGRLGGDEFIILLHGLKLATDVRPVAEHLINSFRKPFIVGVRELVLTASIGISIYPADGQTASELLRNADSAMYHAKEQGRNTYSYFTDKMNKEVSRRLAIEEQIHGALERGEFTVYYQTQVDINHNLIMGAEALLRWSNPALGKISPDEFIPIAEQTGVIIPLGKFVFQQAIVATSLWKKKHASPFRIAINLSPCQFRDPDLVSFIIDEVNQSELSAKEIELEITEGVLLSGHDYITEALGSLSQAGFSIAMDDFGTGYSSLNYLRTYPFNVLKIDRTFINDIEKGTANKELILAMIAMAHALGIRVVAEGVETAAQLDYLKHINCDYAQGFFFSEPDSVVKLLLSNPQPQCNIKIIKSS